MATSDHILRAVEEQGREVAKLSTEVALNSQATATLSSRFVDLNESIAGKGGMAERMAKCETRLDERTKKIRHSSSPPKTHVARWQAVAKIIAAALALAAALGAAAMAANCG